MSDTQLLGLFLHETGPHAGSELWAPVTHNVPWDPEVLEHMVEKEFCHSTGRGEARKCDKWQGLSEAVDDY